MSLSLLNKQTDVTLKFATITETLTCNDIIFTGQTVGGDANFDTLTTNTLNYVNLNPPIPTPNLPLEAIGAAMNTNLPRNASGTPEVIPVTDYTTVTDPVLLPNVSPSTLFSALTNNTFSGGILTIGTAGWYLVNWNLQSGYFAAMCVLIIDGIPQSSSCLSYSQASVISRQTTLLYFNVGQTLQLGIINTEFPGTGFLAYRALNNFIYGDIPNDAYVYTVQFECILVNL